MELSFEEEERIRDALIDLYLNVKVRKAEDIDKYSEGHLTEERESLKNTDILLIIGYIKASVEILMNIKEEEKELFKESDSGISSESACREPPKKYEKLIQGLEEEVRNHIRLEQQLKLHLDDMDDQAEKDERKITELEKNILLLRKKYNSLGQQNKKLKQDYLDREKECQDLRKQITGLVKKRVDLVHTAVNTDFSSIKNKNSSDSTLAFFQNSDKKAPNSSTLVKSTETRFLSETQKLLCKGLRKKFQGKSAHKIHEEESIREATGTSRKHPIDYTTIEQSLASFWAKKSPMKSHRINKTRPTSCIRLKGNKSVAQHLSSNEKCSKEITKLIKKEVACQQAKKLLKRNKSCPSTHEFESGSRLRSQKEYSRILQTINDSVWLSKKMPSKKCL